MFTVFFCSVTGRQVERCVFYVSQDGQVQCCINAAVDDSYAGHHLWRSDSSTHELFFVVIFCTIGRKI